MATILEGLTFDDVLLCPRFSNRESRFNGEISLATTLCSGVDLHVPIISANMDTITGNNLANVMNDVGALGIVHRFMSPEGQAGCLAQLAGPRVLCIGTGKAELDRAKHVIETCHVEVDAILIDIAHGGSSLMVEQIFFIKSTYPDIPVIAGNVATKECADALISAGADCLKVGVGPGSMCSTRIQTGCGIPQLTAIMAVDVARRESGRQVGLIADGGIKNAGDIAKAIAAGADAVMIGALLAGTEESIGGQLAKDGEAVYRGQASKSAQSCKTGPISVEGVEIKVKTKGSAIEVVAGLTSSLLSSFSYLNARNIREFKDHAIFIKQTSLGRYESSPHGEVWLSTAGHG